MDNIIKFPFEVVNFFFTKICFICVFDKPDGKMSVQKIWSTHSYIFFSKMGPS